MTTVISATATFDKSAYTVGDPITVAVVASAVSTVTTPPSSVVEQLSFTAHFVADDGTQQDVPFGPTPVTFTTPGSTVVTHPTVLFDTTAGPITDNTGRVYTIASNVVGNLRLTAVA